MHGQANFYGSAWACKRILFQIKGIGFTPVWSVVVDCFCRSGLIYGQLYFFCCGCTWSHHVNQCSCWPRSSFNQEVVFWAQQSYYYPTSPFPAYKNTHTEVCQGSSVLTSCKDAKSRSSLDGYELTCMRREEQTHHWLNHFIWRIETFLNKWPSNCYHYPCKHWRKCKLNCTVHVVHLNKMLSISLKTVYDVI